MALRNETTLNITNSLLLKPKYADDISYITTSTETYQKIQSDLPIILQEHNLKINHTKTELYEVPKPKPPTPPPPTMAELMAHKHDKPLWSELDWLVNYKPIQVDKTPDWHNCKMLGSYLGTRKDIENRKIITLKTLRKFNNIFQSKVISRSLKIRTFNIYIACIFLYNSETWGISKSMEETIDAFQRRLLRYVINVRWPNKISNKDLMEITKAERWSKTIRRRRLNFLGHIMRLDSETPIRTAIKEAFKTNKNKVGRPYQTWLQTIKDDLKVINIDISRNNLDPIQTLIENTEDRNGWRQKVTEVLMQL